MKKIYSFLFAATALFAAVSCQKEVAPEVEAPKGEKITFTASTEVETKTALYDGYSTIWVEGDQISVFDANKEGNNRCFAIDELSEDAKTATFSYEGEFVKDQSGMADPTVVALYPYQENAYCDFFYYDRNYITGINFPAEQTAVAGSFDSKAAFALGLGTMNEKVLGFQNLYALLKFTVRDAGVKKVTVKVDGENAFIAGDAKIQMTLNTEKIGGSEPVFESPVLSIVENGSNTITLTCEEGFNTEATYYVAVVPTTFTGLSVFFDENETPVNTTEKTMTLEANKIYNLKDLGSPMRDRNLHFSLANISILLNSEEFSDLYLSGYTEGVVYTSSDPTIASVDPNTGHVHGLRAGTVTITAKAPKTRYYYEDEASYILEVRKFDLGMEFSPSIAEGVIGQEFEEPELTMHFPAPELLYESSNPTVATVDENGEVTLLAAGETIITATAIETDHTSADMASYTLTVVEPEPVMCGVYVCISDLGWSSVNMHQFTSAGDITSWPGEALTETVTVAGRTYYKKAIEEGTTLSFTYNNGKASSNFKIDVPNVTVKGDIYYRLSARGAIEVDPNDVKTFGYAIYVFDQKSKNVAPNLYAWNDNNAWKTQYGGNFSTWPGVAFNNDCYYVPADGNNWKHYYYYEIPTALYGKSFKFIVNKSGQTSDLSVTNLAGDLYVGYWYDSASSNGFWANTNLNTPITQ